MRLEGLGDRLVSGIRDKKMMSELLKLKLEELTFDTAVAKCIAIEKSCKDVETMQGGRNLIQFNLLKILNGSLHKGKLKNSSYISKQIWLCYNN